MILVCDQAETECGGVVTPAMRELLTDAGEARPDKIVWVDSRDAHRAVPQRDCEAELRWKRSKPLRAFSRTICAGFARPCESKLLMVTTAARSGCFLTATVRTSGSRPQSEQPVDICGAGDASQPARHARCR